MAFVGHSLLARGRPIEKPYPRCGDIVDSCLQVAGVLLFNADDGISARQASLPLELVLRRGEIGGHEEGFFEMDVQSRYGDVWPGRRKVLEYLDIAIRRPGRIVLAHGSVVARCRRTTAQAKSEEDQAYRTFHDLPRLAQPDDVTGVRRCSCPCR